MQFPIMSPLFEREGERQFLFRKGVCLTFFQCDFFKVQGVLQSLQIILKSEHMGGKFKEEQLNSLQQKEHLYLVCFCFVLHRIKWY